MTLAPSTWIFCIQTFFTRAFIEIYMSLVISWLTIFWRSKSTKHPDTLLDLVFVLKWVKRGIVWTLSVFYAVAADFSKFCHQLSFSRLEKKRDRGECRNHVAIISLSVNLRIEKIVKSKPDSFNFLTTLSSRPVYPCKVWDENACGFMRQNEWRFIVASSGQCFCH